MSYSGNCCTPKGAIVCIDDLQPMCPPPPIARVKFAEIHVPQHQGRLNDAPLGFFLAAPCGSSSISSNDSNSDSLDTQIKRIKLQPKKSRMSSNRKDHIRLRLQPKRKPIDLTAPRVTATTTSKHPRSVSAMSA